MSTKDDAAAQAVDSKLVKALTKKLRDVMLPGDDPFARGELEEAARFMLSTAARRKPGEAAVTLQSALGERRMLRITLNNDDMPFLVDSVAATIAAHGLSIDRLLHPVLRVDRSDAGELTGFPGKQSDAPAESLIYLETERVDAKQRRELEKAIKVTLADVKAAVDDWPKVQELMVSDAQAIADIDPEGCELLRWLNSNMLTQLGHVTRRRDGSKDGHQPTEVANN